MVFFILSIISIISGIVIAFKKGSQKAETGDTIIQQTQEKQSPAIISKGNDSSVNISYGRSSEEDKEELSKKKDSDEGKNNATTQSSHHIKQNTEGNQSPAVVSDGKVNITIENK